MNCWAWRIPEYLAFERRRGLGNRRANLYTPENVRAVRVLQDVGDVLGYGIRDKADALTPTLLSIPGLLHILANT